MSEIQQSIGKLLTGGEQRDAIHVAIAPAVAGHAMKPGDSVGLGDDGKARTCGTVNVGIVDPYLTKPVKAGQRFWLFLYPGTVTGMRHEWTHPAFVAATEIKDHESWLRLYAQRMNKYDTPPEAFNRLIDGLRSGELFSHGSDLHGLDELDDPDDLRRHAEAYLGITIQWDHFTFSCSC